MISTVAQLFEEIAKCERQVLASEKVTHPGTIGSMYEGLTAKLLSASLPPTSEPLAVVRGFITSEEGEVTSGEIDCMVVVGDGVQIPYTNQYKYPLSQVLAVFEVKKKSRRKDLDDALIHLASINELLPEEMAPNYLSDESTSRLLGYRPWLAEMYTGRNSTDANLIRMCVANSYLPLRVVLTHSGYRTTQPIEELLERFVKSGGCDDYGVASLPDLFVDEDQAYVKMLGVPYAARCGRNRWPVFGHTRVQAALVLLESIYWRLESIVLEHLPVFSDHDRNPELTAVLGMSFDPNKVHLFPMEGLISAEAQASSSAEAGIEICEEEFFFLGQFQSALSVDIRDYCEALNKDYSVVLRMVGRLCRLRILFLVDGRAFVNLSAMRLMIGPVSEKFLVGEDVRGRFCRNTAPWEDRTTESSGPRILHVFVDNPLDFNILSMASEEAVLGPQSAEWLRFRHSQALKKELENQQESKSSQQKDPYEFEF